MRLVKFNFSRCDENNRLVFNYILVVFVCLKFSLYSSSQVPIIHEFELPDVSPSLQFFDIHQDFNGELWFATDRGIIRYNGSNTFKFTREDGLSDDEIFNIVPQGDSILWFITGTNELCYLIDDNILKYPFNDTIKKYSPINSIQQIGFDTDGSLYVRQKASRGYLKISSDGKVMAEPIKGDGTGLLRPTVIQRNELSNGTFHYFIDSQEANPLINPFNKFKVIEANNCRYMLATKSIFIFKNGNLQKRIDFKSQLINIELIDNRLLVSEYFGGIHEYDLDGNFLRHYLGDKLVTKILKDHEGTYWYTTLSNGVFFSRNPNFKIYPTGNSYILSLTERNGEIFASTYNASIHQIKNHEISVFRAAKEHNKSFVRFNKSRNELYIAQNNIPVIELNSKQINVTHFVSRISDNDEGPTIVITRHNTISLIQKYNLESFIVNQVINDAEPYKNQILYGTSNGIYTLDWASKKSKKFSSIKYQGKISDIDYLPEYDLLLIGTLNNGVIIYQKGKTTTITKKDGLVSNTISEVYIENNNDLWIGTNEGLSKLTLFDGKYHSKNITVADGLIDIEITSIVVCKDEVYVGTRNGLCSFDKNILKINNFDDVPLYFKINNVFVNGDKVQLHELQDLSYSQNNIEIELQSISYVKKSKIRYRYKIPAVEDKWIEFEGPRLQLGYLPAGKYSLIIEAFDNHGRSELISIPNIEIFPPFYQSWWFICSIGVLVCFVIWLFFRYRIFIYNKNLVRELLRLLVKRLKKKEVDFFVKSSGKKIKVNSLDIAYIKASGNYLEIIFVKGMKKVVFREKISNFLKLVPDPLEYKRVHRSTIVRIDKIQSKSKESLTVNGTELKIGISYQEELEDLEF